MVKIGIHFLSQSDITCHLDLIVKCFFMLELVFNLSQLYCFDIDW